MYLLLVESSIGAHVLKPFIMMKNLKLLEEVGEEVLFTPPGLLACCRIIWLAADVYKAGRSLQKGFVLETVAVTGRSLCWQEDPDLEISLCNARVRPTPY